MYNNTREQIYQALLALLSAPLSFQATSSSSVTLTLPSSIMGLCYGEPISGPGVAPGTSIGGVDDGGGNLAIATVTLSAPTTSAVSQGTFLATPYTYTTRKSLDIKQVPEAMRPALIMVDKTEEYAPEFTGQPSLITLHVMLGIYIWADGLPQDASGMTLINPRLDALDQLLAPKSMLETQAQTLGGKVNHCWIEGRIYKVSGDLDGDGVAVVPIAILVPS